MAMTPHERLRRWLKNSGLKQIEGAKLIGLHPSDFNRFLSGIRVPGRDNAVKIKRVTGIQIEDWAPIVVDEELPATGTHGRK